MSTKLNKLFNNYQHIFNEICQEMEVIIDNIIELKQDNIIVRIIVNNIVFVFGCTKTNKKKENQDLFNIFIKTTETDKLDIDISYYNLKNEEFIFKISKEFVKWIGDKLNEASK